jgi:WD40 repeat protein
MKALEKDRNRRYESASAFAADVQRYLDDEPVQACPPSVGYRLRKFARRNKAAVMTTVLVVAAVLLGSALSLWKYLDERKARREADYHRKQSDLNAEEARTNAEEARTQTSEAVRATGEADRARQDADRQRTAMYQNLYYADIRLGSVDWNAGNLARLTRKHWSHVPQPGGTDHRGWEWYFLLSLCHQDERTLLDHADLVTAVAWSPNGRYLASTSLDGSTKVWDSKSWRLLRTFNWGRTWKKGIAWSPDSQRLAWGAVADDNSVYVWHMQTDKIQTLRGHTSSVWTVAWSPDGKQLASGGLDNTIRIWEPATNSCRHVLKGKKSSNVEAVAWSPDGKRLAAADWIRIQIWDTVSGQLLLHDDLPNQGSGVAWGPDGKHLAVATNAGQCFLYKAADCSRTSRWDAHNGAVNWLAWNREGSRLASAGADNLIKLWDPESPTCVGILRGHINQVNCVAWEPNGHRLASGSMDGKVKVWSIPPAPQPLRLAGHLGGIQALVWSKDAATLQSLGVADGLIARWEVASGKRVAEVPLGRFKSGLFNSTGERVVVVTRFLDFPALLIRDARSGKLLQMVKAMIPARLDSNCLSFSPDGSRLALVKGWQLKVVDLQRDEICFQRQGSGYEALSWSPDGRFLACAGPGDASDGSWLQWTGWVQVFDLEKRQRLWKLQPGTHDVMATAVTWSPNGQRLVSGDVNGLAVVWEATTGQKVMSVQLHTAAIKALAWSPDGRRIASGGEDQAVVVWDAIGGEELLRFDVPTGVTHLRWSADGRRLAAACKDGTIQIWDASIGYRFVNSEAYYTDQLLAQNSKALELREAGRNDEAGAMLEQALKDSKAKLGADHHITLRIMRDHARYYRTAGRPQHAIPLFEQTLEKRKATLGPDHPDTIRTMNELATVYQDAGRMQEAIVLFEQSLEKRKGTLGPDDEETLISMNNLAVAYKRVGRFPEAIALLEPTLQKQKATLGPDHEDTLISMNNLGSTYLSVGRFPEAIALCKSVLEKRKATLGLDHKDTLISVNDLAVAYLYAGRVPEAIALLEPTLEKMKATLGPDHELTLKGMFHLAVAYTESGRFDQGESPLRDLLHYQRKKDDPKSARLVGALEMLGTILLKQQQYVAAEPLLRECLGLREQRMPDDCRRFFALSLLGGALLGQKKYTEAEPLLLQGYEGMKQREAQFPQRGKRLLSETVERLVRLYEATNQPDKARTWREKLSSGKRPGN